MGLTLRVIPARPAHASGPHIRKQWKLLAMPTAAAARKPPTAAGLSTRWPMSPKNASMSISSRKPRAQGFRRSWRAGAGDDRAGTAFACRAGVDARSTCRHCKSPIPPSMEGKDFCCTGCEAVYGLLHREGLGRYYELAGDKTAPVGEVSGPRSHSWLEPLVARAEEAGGSICTLDLDVQGIHCAACVWLMSELFKREKGGVSLHVNPGLGKVRLAWKRGGFDVERFVSRVEEFGYLFGPSKKTSNESTRSLLLRLGATAAIAGNVMLFSLAFYTGLGPEDGVVYELFTKRSVALSALVVFVGGWPFFRSAWKALSKGVLHLDLPIAAGILLAFGASLYQARGGQGELYYFDTLNVFVLLMLVGRW